MFPKWRGSTRSFSCRNQVVVAWGGRGCGGGGNPWVWEAGVRWVFCIGADFFESLPPSPLCGQPPSLFGKLIVTDLHDRGRVRRCRPNQRSADETGETGEGKQ